MFLNSFHFVLVFSQGSYSIVKHTEGGGGGGRWLERSEPKTPKYLSKNNNVKNAKIIPPKYFSDEKLCQRGF